MSWTREVDIATRFATEGISGRPRHGLRRAYIDEPGLSEKEWVVDPDGLRDETVRPHAAG